MFPFKPARSAAGRTSSVSNGLIGVAVFAGVSLLAACSGSVSGLDGSTLESQSAPIVEKADLPLDLNGSWQTWQGGQSAVYYDAGAGQLRIPATGQQLTRGVRRFDQSLQGGQRYSLSVQSASSDVRALMFFFDSAGQAIASAPGVSAQSGSPAVFDAPYGVAGFHLQVQGGWWAGNDASLSLRLSTDAGQGQTVSQGAAGNELIDLAGQWSDWNGQTQGVYFDGGSGQLVLPTPSAGRSQSQGVKRFSTSLQSGQEYVFSATQASDTGSAALLFLYDGSGQPTWFSTVSGQSVQSLYVGGTNQVAFYAPAGVTGFAVQVQSAQWSGAQATIRPSLVAGSASSTGQGVSSGGTTTAPPPPEPAPSGGATQGSNGERPRVVVITDANYSGGDPDDKQSLAHVLWYANELDIRAIVPQLWNGQGYTVAMESINAYQQDYYAYGMSGKGYPSPDDIKARVPYTQSAALDLIIREADASGAPLYVLLWGEMSPLRDVLYRRPDLVSKLRVLSIASDRMNDPGNCARSNWNGGGRNDIFNDSRFNNLWWVESNWTYNGMFDGDRPAQVLGQLSGYGSLGWYQQQAVSGVSWAQYFRAGDTPTVLYLIDPSNNLDNPTQGSWAGQFTRPFPGQRPNYYTDSAGGQAWDYWNPCNTWGSMQAMFDNSKATLEARRESMYGALFGKLNWIYNR